MTLDSSCLSSRSETKKKGQETGSSTATETNSRSKVVPLPSNTSRCPAAEVIQMRSLDGTVYGKRSAEEIEK